MRKAAAVREQGRQLPIVFVTARDSVDDKIKGLTISICTTARTDNDAKLLLRALGFPFRN